MYSKRLLLICFLTFTVSHHLWAMPQTVPLAWTASPDAAVTGYKLYWSNTSGNYTATNSIDVKNVTSYVLTGLSPGTYFTAATAYTADHIESPFSNEISFVIPKPPILLTINSAWVGISSFKGANLLVQSTSDLKTWTPETTIVSASADFIKYPIVKSAQTKFYKASYVEVATGAVPQIKTQKLPPQLPTITPPKLTLVQKLKLFLHYRPGHHPDTRKGAEVLTGK